MYNKMNREQGFQTEGKELSEDQHLHVTAQFFTSLFPRGTPQAYESQTSLVTLSLFVTTLTEIRSSESGNSA